MALFERIDSYAWKNWVERNINTFLKTLKNIPSSLVDLTNNLLNLENRIDTLELHAYDTLWIDFWTGTAPTSVLDGEIWYDSTNKLLWCWNDDIINWLSIPLNYQKLYIKRQSNEVYSWSGSTMVSVSAQVTKAIIESLLTGEISSHTHPFTPTTTLLSTHLADAVQEAASLGNKLQIIDSNNWGSNPTKTLNVNMFNRFTANQTNADSVTIVLGAVNNTNLTNNFYFTFRTGATVPSAITFPTTNVKWLNNVPLVVGNLSPNKIYEVLFEVLDSNTILVSYGEF